ncbi:hypothetical protein J3U99_20650 [Brucella pituitosa]|uniref:hypothetical protein n=1 Tax=Brucella pituitosa TaxID=571256 RepID=UPI002006B60C|nr:hypothetical protein [Brucella pituitosa]MCK4207182.1 hypothetical protein [Brucella pituitosa]
MDDPRLAQLANTYPQAWNCFACHGIRVVVPNAVPGIGETRAIGTLDRLIKKYGEEHADFVVMTLAESHNNRNFIDETTLWAVSDMVRTAKRNYPSIMENDLENWFTFWDGTPLGVLADWCHDLDGLVSKRPALVGMLFERMLRHFGEMRQQPDLLDDRRMTG